MTLTEILRLKSDAIAQRWARVALGAYPDDSARLFRREKDPFANPVGHSVREGTRAILHGVIEGRDQSELRRHLDDVIRIRAVQQMTPSRAVGFVFDLKSAIRAELGEEDGDAGFVDQLAQLDEQIDRLALAAFDVYAECRQRVSDLKVNEVKRSVSWVIDRMNQRAERERLPDQSSVETTDEVNVRREGMR